MNTNSAVELIDAIKLRPAMYLTKCYISCLKAYLDGWYLKAGDIEDDFMQEFQDWIAAKYDIRSFHSWANIILFHSQDECSALKDFFDLFEEWKRIRKGRL